MRLKIAKLYVKMVGMIDLTRTGKLVNEEYREKFDLLADTLIEYNKMFNLTAITQIEDIFNKHFVDSAVGECFFPHGAFVAEIGSGGGFPSLPLKIVRDDLDFTLIESTGKKCRYLDICVDKLALGGVKVLNIRAEEGGRDAKLREKFDCAVARAVARLNTLAEYCMPYVRKGGRFIAYKGDAEEELKEAERAIKVLGGEVEYCEKFSLCGEKRTIIVIRKVAPTPQKYPRGQGKERKEPIL